VIVASTLVQIEGVNPVVFAYGGECGLPLHSSLLSSMRIPLVPTPARGLTLKELSFHKRSNRFHKSICDPGVSFFLLSTVIPLSIDKKLLPLTNTVLSCGGLMIASTPR
jgi:hypothetical protein